MAEYVRTVRSVLSYAVVLQYTCAYVWLVTRAGTFLAVWFDGEVGDVDLEHLPAAKDRNVVDLRGYANMHVRYLVFSQVPLEDAPTCGVVFVRRWSGKASYPDVLDEQ